MPLAWAWAKLRALATTAARAPAWVWGALVAALTGLLLVLKARRAEERADAAEEHALEADTHARTAEARAEVRLEEQTVVRLEEQRREVRADGELLAERMHDMSDEETTIWLQHDAEKRRKGDT